MSALDYNLCTAIEDTVQTEGLRPLGRALGLSHNTIAAHGAKLDRWSADELIRLADHNEAVRLALIARLQPVSVSSLESLERSAIQVISDSSRLNEALANDLSDGRISAREATEALPRARAELETLRVVISLLEMRERGQA
jgi:hypothetical protein